MFARMGGIGEGTSAPRASAPCWGPCRGGVSWSSGTASAGWATGGGGVISARIESSGFPSALRRVVKTELGFAAKLVWTDFIWYV